MAAVRYTSEFRSSVIKEVQSGKTVSEVCLNHHISRTIFYRWFKAYKTTVQKKKLKKGLITARKQSISAMKERKIVQAAIKQPEAALTILAAQCEVTSMTIWRVLKKHNLNTKQLRKHYVTQYGKRVRRDIPYKERLILLKRFRAGESVSSVCREAGISRTIFYRWLKAVKQDSEHKALQNKRPRGENHWRKQRLLQAKSAEIVTAIFRLASEYPRYSLEKLYETFVAQTHAALSKSSLLYDSSSI